MRFLIRSFLEEVTTKNGEIMNILKDRYLSIDLGIKNPITMVDSGDGKCLILGRDYISRGYYFDKKIKELEKIYQAEGIFNFDTKKMLRLKDKKEHTLQDILHKLTHYIVEYAKKKRVTCVVVGKIKEKPGSPFPYELFYRQLRFKLAKIGVDITKHSEAYTSQCAPSSESVDKKYANKSNRVQRGLFVDGDEEYNADGVGAFNILKSFFQKYGIEYEIPVDGIKNPEIIIVSAN